MHWFSGTGKGGQYRNKHQNCCRIIHNATGLMTIGQRSREREANLKDAFTRLAAKLLALDEKQAERRHSSKVVRTYHFERGQVLDHSTGLVRAPSKVMDGELDDFLLTPGERRRETKLR